MRRTTLGAVVGVAVLAAGIAQAAGVPGQGTWETTLKPRELDGNKGICTPNDGAPGSCVEQPGSGLSNTGGFESLQSYAYWSGTEYPPDSDFAWWFMNDYGFQTSYGGKTSVLYAVAVRPGDVPVVPEPQTYAMLLLGMSAVLLAVRRQRPR
jgi:hypothetical protein